MATLTIKPTAAGNDVQIKSGDGNTTHATFGDTNNISMSTGSIASAVTGTLGSGIVFPAGHILQVVSTTMTDVLSIAGANSYNDIAGLTATITPSFTSSKILIMCDVAITNASSNCYIALLRGSSFVGVGPSSGSRSRVSSSNFYNSGTNNLVGTSFQYLDSPSTTSATTYKLQSITDTSVATYVNRTSGDADAVYGVRSQSTITLMEVKG